MEEKTIISGTVSNFGKGFRMVALVLLAIGIALVIVDFAILDGAGISWFLLTCVPGVVMFIIATIITASCKNTTITVTNMRVYGTAIFKKRVDLPLDSISAVGTCFMHGIVISSSSGVIKFRGIPNNAEIHNTISKLLLERQNNKNSQSAPTVIQQSDSADQLKKFKELLDSGVITQEEFDEKKKQLLGL